MNIDDIKHEVAVAISQVGLEGFEERKIQELSGGQQQRVALARSLAKKAKEYISDYKFKHNINPCVLSIAKHCKINENKALLIAELAGINVLSIDKNIEHEDRETNVEYQDVKALTPFQETDKAETSKIISKIIASLPLKRQIIINKRFGLNGEDFTDLATIGKQLNLTKERVRQIEKEVIQTIYKKWPSL